MLFLAAALVGSLCFVVGFIAPAIATRIRDGGPNGRHATIWQGALGDLPAVINGGLYEPWGITADTVVRVVRVKAD